MASATTTIRRGRSASGAGRRSRRGTNRGDSRGHGAVTLEDFVVEIWAGVASAGQASCPVCAGHQLRPDGCADCGSHLF